MEVEVQYQPLSTEYLQISLLFVSPSTANDVDDDAGVVAEATKFSSTAC